MYNISKENALIITDYIQAMRAETNLSDNYRRDVIKLLYVFCKYEKKDKPFRLVTRIDVLAFLDSFRRPEASDPMHKWIGTYNTYRIHLLRFFKWLYSPDIEPDKRPRPEIIQNIPKLRLHIVEVVVVELVQEKTMNIIFHHLGFNTFLL